MRTVRNLTLLLVIAVLVGVACWGCTSVQYRSKRGVDGSSERSISGITTRPGAEILGMAGEAASGLAGFLGQQLPGILAMLGVGGPAVGGLAAILNSISHRKAKQREDAAWDESAKREREALLIALAARGAAPPQVVPAGGPAAGAGAGAAEVKGIGGSP